MAHTLLNPVAPCRLYSDYLYFGIANKSAEDFHEKVSDSLQLFEGCLAEFTMRSCVYNTTVNNAMPVSEHIPDQSLKDWKYYTEVFYMQQVWLRPDCFLVSCQCLRISLVFKLNEAYTQQQCWTASFPPSVTRG